MGCCGGGNFNILIGAQTMADNMGTFSNKKVKLEYTGTSMGTLQFIGRVTGSTYNAGDNSLYKYVDIEPADREYMLSLGVFKVLNEEQISTDQTSATSTDQTSATSTDQTSATSTKKKKTDNTETIDLV
jgi:hypothetical protein